MPSWYGNAVCASSEDTASGSPNRNDGCRMQAELGAREGFPAQLPQGRPAAGYAL